MNNLRDGNFHNMVDDPFLVAAENRKGVRNACGFNGFCGFAATGDEAITDAAAVPAGQIGTPINAKVYNTTAWQYAKTILALVGLYVVGKYVWSKWVKK